MVGVGGTVGVTGGWAVAVGVMVPVGPGTAGARAVIVAVGVGDAVAVEGAWVGVAAAFVTELSPPAIASASTLATTAVAASVGTASGALPPRHNSHPPAPRKAMVNSSPEAKRKGVSCLIVFFRRGQ